MDFQAFTLGKCKNLVHLIFQSLICKLCLKIDSRFEHTIKKITVVPEDWRYRLFR